MRSPASRSRPHPLQRRSLLACAAAPLLSAWAAPAGAQVLNLNDAVNQAGRQRMLSQRLAKYFLVRAWQAPVPDAQAQSVQAEREFSAALDVLGNAPEATPAIRQDIELGRAQWVFFANALARVGGGLPRPRHGAEVFSTSENLLQLRDRVTGQYARLGAG